MTGMFLDTKAINWKSIIIIICGLSLLGGGVGDNPAAAAPASNSSGDPAPKGYLFAASMQLPGKARAKIFLPADKRANFTSFDGVRDLAVKKDRLVFTLAGKSARLGWGNCRGRQAVADIDSTFPEVNLPVIRVRQFGGGESRWAARFWRDGLRISGGQSRTLVPGEWQELTFAGLNCPGASPDGLDFTITGEPGEKFEIAWFKLQQTVYAGVVRSEFTLPEGKIWRAVANVIASNDRDITEQRDTNGIDRIACRFYLNGRLVERRGAKHLEHLDPVDITPYLRPGKNCMGFQGFRISRSPLLYIQGRVIMESGEIIELKSGPGWMYSQEEAKGWSLPGFDDHAWQKVLPGPLPKIQDRRLQDFNRQVGIPAYSGYLVIKNPARKDLFYSDQEDVIVNVKVPVGLAAKQPELAYAFGRADAEGKSHLLKAASIGAFTRRDGSLIYQIDLGRHSHGVYTLALTLTGKSGRIIASRPREPLVVLRKLRPKLVDGRNYREGLDLELEDTIDFTNPDDPHPWVEGVMPVPMLNTVAGRVTVPRIIRDGELQYREVTSPRRGSGFSYRIEFKHPGSFYYFELEYPDNAKRIIEVIISSKAGVNGKYDVWTNSQSGVGAETGGKMMLSNKMQTLKWLHIADPGPHSIDIINCENGERAAAKSLKIYRVKGDLPAVASGGKRHFGIMSERCFPTSGIGMNFGCGITNSDALIRERDKGKTMMEIYVRNLAWLEQTCDNYLQYLKFCGQNLHIFGCYQYNEIYNPFIPSPLLDDSRVLMCMKTILANGCDLNGIDFYAGVEFSQARETQSFANNAQVAQGADTVCMVDAQGRQRYIYDPYSQVSNWLHPRQREKFMELFASLADTFGHLRHFRGIHNLVSPDRQSGYWGPAFGVNSQYDNPLSASFDDVSMALFENDTGIKLPVSGADPQRFAKRAAFLSRPEIKPRYLAWRAEKFTELLTDGLQTLREKRPDLELVNVLTLGDRKFIQNLENSGQTLGEKLKEFAIDLDAIKRVDGLWAARWIVGWQHWYPQLPHRDPYFWFARTDPAYIAAFDRDRYRGVFVRTSWDENFFFPGGSMLDSERGGNDRLVESDWIMNAERIRVLPQLAGDYAREAHIQALITADPELIIGGWTDININVGHAQVLREIMKSFTRLPEEKFTPVLNTWLDTNLAIRLLNRENESYLYVANPGYWGITGDVTLKTTGKVYNLASGKQVALSSVSSAGQQEMPVTLAPFGLAAYRIDSPRVEVTGYDTAPISKPAIAHMDNILARVSQLLYDPKLSGALQADERAGMEKTLKAARQALAAEKYARAWYLITQPRFWMWWKDFLEKAVTSLAVLPEQFRTQPPPEDPDKLPTLEVRRVNQPIKIDGNLDEPIWREGRYASGFWMISPKRPSMMETGVQAAYDDKNLYLAFVCADPQTAELKADARREDEIYASKDDVLAFFIQPEPADSRYCQFAFNTRGTQFDQRVTGNDRDYAFHPPWKVAVKVGQGYWSAEVAMPFSAFGLSAPPEVMKANFHRAVRKEMIEASSWSYLSQRDWHVPQRFGYLRFEK